MESTHPSGQFVKPRITYFDAMAEMVRRGQRLATWAQQKGFNRQMPKRALEIHPGGPTSQRFIKALHKELGV